MKKITFLIIFFIGGIYSAQDLDSLDNVYNSKADEFYEKIFAGNKNALYSIPEFLSDDTEFTRVTSNGSSRKSTLKYIALSTLYNYCYFNDLLFDENISSSKFESYLKESASKIKYYSLFERFTDLDVENYILPSRILKVKQKEQKSLKQLISAISELNKEEKYKEMISLYWEIGELNTPKAEKYLLNAAKGKNWSMNKCDHKENILSGIAFSLRHFRTKPSLTMLMTLANEYDLYAMQDWMKSMAQITNIDLVIINQSYRNIVNHYQNRIDSLKSIEKIKEQGYEVFGNLHNVDVNDPVAMISAIDPEWWILVNLKEDYIQKKNPLILKALSRRLLDELYVYNDKSEENKYKLFEKYKWGSIDLDIGNMLNDLTGTQVELEYKGEWVDKSDDFLFNVAMINYWNKHYTDYEFNTNTEVFVNTKAEILEASKVKVLFENMHTDNDSLAMNSYLTLVEQKPEDVIREMKNFKMDNIFGNLNDNLPMFTRKFIVQHAYFTQYCREIGKSYHPSGELKKILITLRDEDFSFEEQVNMEKKLLSLLTLENIAEAESFGISYGSKMGRVTGPLGHVLDQFYSAKRDEIVRNEKELKFYLYKGAIFDRLGIIGVVNNYIRKLENLTEDQLKLLEVIKSSETDEDILESLNKALQKNLPKVKSEMMTFVDFLKEKETISIENLALIEVDFQNKFFLEKFFTSYNEEKNAEVLSKYMGLMEEQLTPEMIPYLVRYSNKHIALMDGRWGGTDTEGKRHNVTFNAYTDDFFVYYLEKITDHFGTAPRPSLFNHDFVSSSRSGPMFLWNRFEMKDAWIKKWNTDSINYMEWGENYFIEKLKELKNQKEITAELIEETVTSDFWNAEEHSQYLKEVEEKMSCDELLMVKTDWDVPGVTARYIIEKCDLTADQLLDLADEYSTFEFESIIVALKKAYPTANKMIFGKKFNSLCWSDYFRDFLKEIEHREWAIKVLEYYYQNTNDSFDKEYAESFYWDLKLSPMAFSERLKILNQQDSKGAMQAKENVWKDANYEDLKSNWDAVEKMANSSILTSFRREFGLFLDGHEVDDLKRMKKVIEENPDSQSAALELLSFYFPLKTPANKLDHQLIFELLKYGNINGFVGSHGREWNNFHQCLRKYLEVEFGEDLVSYQKEKFADKEAGYLNVLMNYMVHKGWVDSQKNVPVSFAGDKGVWINE